MIGFVYTNIQGSVMKKLTKMAFAGLFLAVSGLTSAGMIDSEAVLLDDAGASLIEGWLGQGDLDWDSVWYAETNTGATSASWHSVVDALTHTVSIYQAVNAVGQNVLVGGYTANDWSGSSYKHDQAAFIFNLTYPEYQEVIHSSLATYADTSYFATFGGGHDLFGGRNELISNVDVHRDGYVYSHSYDLSKGTIDVGDNIAYNNNNNFRVIALETYTFSTQSEPSAEVPEPASFAMLGLGVSFLAFSRRKRKVKNQ